VKVLRNDEITLEQIDALFAPETASCISPGPCSPAEAGMSVAAIKAFAGKLPILGVCLGHQSIGAAFGGASCARKVQMHGKTAGASHHEQGVFAGLPNPLTARATTRWSIERSSLPDCLEITAWTEDGEIMGVRHKTLDGRGRAVPPRVHPHRVGHALLKNFLDRGASPPPAAA
jgi:anthranilate synthase component 2